MEKVQKIDLIIKYIYGIEGVEISSSVLKKQLEQKNDQELEGLLLKLNEYHQKQNILDKNFIAKLDKFNNDFNEAVESVNEKIEIENEFNF